MKHIRLVYPRVEKPFLGLFRSENVNPIQAFDFISCRQYNYLSAITLAFTAFGLSVPVCLVKEKTLTTLLLDFINKLCENIVLSILLFS